MALVALALLPTLESLSRSLAGRSFYSSAEAVQHLVLWVALLGGMITTREERHLALTAGMDALKGTTGAVVRTLASALSALVCAALAVSALSFLIIGFEPGRHIGLVPMWVVGAIMPIGFAVMAARFAWAIDSPRVRAPAGAAALLLGILFAWQPLLSVLRAALPAAEGIGGLEAALAGAVDPVLRLAAVALMLVLVAGAFVGLPLFVVLGGLAFFLFLRSGGSLEVIPNEAYTLLTGPDPAGDPAVHVDGLHPLREPGSRQARAISFTRYLGWLRGGPVVLSIIVCAFFTTFTGGSGVTILAMGGSAVSS